MGKLKRFLSTSAVYFIGSVLSKLVVFFLLPLYTSKISPDQYGIYDLVIAFINLFAPIIFIQIWDGMFRASFDCTEISDKYKIISNSLVVCFVGAVVYFLGFTIIQAVFDLENFIYILIYGFVFSIHYLYGYICRVFLNNKLYVVSGLINTLITAVINIVLILVFNWDVKSLYLSPTIGMFMQILIIEFKYKALGNFKLAHINKNSILKMIKFSIPLCFAAISYWLLSGFSRLLITNVLGAADNGIFAIANRFASMTVLIITIFQYAWNELAYIMSNDSGRVKMYNVCIDLLIKFVILGSAGICILIKIIFPYLIHEQYAVAINIIPATIIGSMLNAMAGFVGTLFMTEKKTNGIMYSTLLAAGINIALGIVMTNLFGIHGATIALAIAFLVLMIIRLLQAKKQFSIKYNWKTCISVVCVLILSIFEYYFVNNIVIDICAVIAIVAILVLSNKKYFSIFFNSIKK